MAVLVVGATGSVGGDVTLKLAKSGASVSALVRGGKAHVKASQLLAAGVGIVDGDLTRPDTLASAMPPRLQLLRFTSRAWFEAEFSAHS